MIQYIGLLKSPEWKTMSKEKNKGGRPVYWTKERREKLCDDFEKWITIPNNVWFKDFVWEQNMNMDSWYKIAKENERLQGIIKKAKLKQENFLVKGGLFNKLNGAFAKFILQANYPEKYGNVDKKEKRETIININSTRFSVEEEGEGEEK